MGKLKLYDTLAYTPKVTLYTNDTLGVVLKDNCTHKNDTAFMILRLLKPSILTTAFADTLVCKGTMVNYKAQPWFANNYVWQWKDVTNNKILSTADSLSLTANTTLKIKLTLTNGCTEDSNVFILNVHPPLKANILSGKGDLNDTTVCFGQWLNLTTKGNGGKGSGYFYKWIWNANLISKTDTLLLKPTSTSALTLILTDNCTKTADTLSRTIKIIESPKADFSYGLTCSRTNTDFTFTGAKPKAPVTTVFTWNFNNESTSFIENPSHLFSASGFKTVKLNLNSSNGCADTINKILEIKPQSKAAFTTFDVCERDSASFSNKSKDANSYSWRFGDGLKSNVTSPKHLYNIGGVSQTFNVTLVAVVNGGCSDSVVNAITINSNPVSDFTYTTNQNKVDFKATQSGNTSYKWLFGNGDSVESSNKDYSYTYSKQSGKYKACLKTTNVANCFSETCKEISITVGVSLISKPQGFKIYPNPNSGNFTIEIDNPSKEVSIGVYDYLGKLVQSVETLPLKLFYYVDLNVADGIYFVKVMNGGFVFIDKLSITK